MHNFYLYVWRSLRGPFSPFCFVFSKFLPSLNLNESKNRSNSRVMNALKCIERTFWLFLLGLWLVLVKLWTKYQPLPHWRLFSSFWNFLFPTLTMWKLHLFGLPWRITGRPYSFFFLSWICFCNYNEQIFICKPLRNEVLRRNRRRFVFCDSFAVMVWICAVNGTRSALFVDLWKCSRRWEVGSNRGFVLTL